MPQVPETTSDTIFILQLEQSAIATATNYPAGRHSRYQAVLAEASFSIQERNRGWSRLAFYYLDSLNSNAQTATSHTMPVDTIILLVAPGTVQSGTFYLTHFDSYRAASSSPNAAISTAPKEKLSFSVPTWLRHPRQHFTRMETWSVAATTALLLKIATLIWLCYFLIRRFRAHHHCRRLKYVTATKLYDYMPIDDVDILVRHPVILEL